MNNRPKATRSCSPFLIPSSMLVGPNPPAAMTGVLPSASRKGARLISFPEVTPKAASLSDRVRSSSKRGSMRCLAKKEHVSGHSTEGKEGEGYVHVCQVHLSQLLAEVGPLSDSIFAQSLVEQTIWRETDSYFFATDSPTNLVHCIEQKSGPIRCGTTVRIRALID